jgi:hypothetical protein
VGVELLLHTANRLGRERRECRAKTIPNAAKKHITEEREH